MLLRFIVISKSAEIITKIYLAKLYSLIGLFNCQSFFQLSNSLEALAIITVKNQCIWAHVPLSRQDRCFHTPCSLSTLVLEHLGIVCEPYTNPPNQ